MFDANWKDEVEGRVCGYSSLSEEAGDAVLDKGMERERLHNPCFPGSHPNRQWLHFS